VKSVLIIEDEAIIRRVLTRVLERAGFIVRTAENGDDALQQLRVAEVDIVITDIIMPKMHGVDAIKKIVKEFSRVRIIAISAHQALSDRGGIARDQSGDQGY
jgi:YesN/AraC family two-component response regulator